MRTARRSFARWLALAFPAFVLFAACFGRSREVAASGPSPTVSPLLRQVEREREPKDLSERRLEQQEKSLDGLTDDQLFKELDEALSGERTNNVLNRLRVAGTLETAHRLDVLAARIRAGETRKGPLLSAGLLEYFAEEIRFRHTGDRKHHVRALLIITNPADDTLGRTFPDVREIVREGIVEARGNLVGHVGKARREKGWAVDHDREVTRRAIMLLDLWEQAKTAEETFVRAVEQSDYPPLKACGVSYLLELDKVTDSTRIRVREALKPSVEAAGLRMRTPKGSATPSTSCETVNSATSEDFVNTCALYGFWLKHSKEELRAAEARRYFVCGAPCSLHYEEGAAVGDDRCP